MSNCIPSYNTIQRGLETTFSIGSTIVFVSTIICAISLLIIFQNHLAIKYGNQMAYATEGLEFCWKVTKGFAIAGAVSLGVTATALFFSIFYERKTSYESKPLFKNLQ